MRRHGPEESVAVIEIIGPFVVADQICLGDLDLDDGETALRIDRHQVRAAAVGKRHFADGEQVMATEQTRDSTGHFRCDR